MADSAQRSAAHVFFILVVAALHAGAWRCQHREEVVARLSFGEHSQFSLLLGQGVWARRQLQAALHRCEVAHR